MTQHARCARSVLFDLDGTLVDSAPDLAGAANDMRAGAWPAGHALRDAAADGGRGRARHARHGASASARATRGYDALRDGVPGALRSAHAARDACLRRAWSRCSTRWTQRGLPWGIVTNKAARFTVPLVDGLGLQRARAVLISGDTTPHAKPHPAPLLEAARRTGAGAAATASTSATTCVTCRPAAPPAWPTLAAAWGYLGRGEPIARLGCRRRAGGSRRRS